MYGGLQLHHVGLYKEAADDHLQVNLLTLLEGSDEEISGS